MYHKNAICALTNTRIYKGDKVYGFNILKRYERLNYAPSPFYIKGTYDGYGDIDCNDFEEVESARLLVVRSYNDDSSFQSIDIDTEHCKTSLSYRFGNPNIAGACFIHADVFDNMVERIALSHDYSFNEISRDIDSLVNDIANTESNEFKAIIISNFFHYSRANEFQEEHSKLYDLICKTSNSTFSRYKEGIGGKLMKDKKKEAKNLILSAIKTSFINEVFKQTKKTWEKNNSSLAGNDTSNEIDIALFKECLRKVKKS